MEKLRIGQMAKLNNVSEQALRLYDRLGLLKPGYIDPETGYRYYDASQATLLDIIKYMKSLGIQLSEIKRQLEKADTPFIINLLHERLKWLDEEALRIKAQKTYISNVLEGYTRYENPPPDGVILLEFHKDRYYYLIDTGEEIYGQEPISDEIIRYNRGMRLLREKMEERGLPSQFTCNSGVIDRQFGRERTTLSSTEIFSFVDPSYAGQNDIHKYPAGVFLSVYCSSFTHEMECCARMLEEVERMQYTVCGDYICEELVMLPGLGEYGRQMFYRMQLPIQFNTGNP